MATVPSFPAGPVAVTWATPKDRPLCRTRAVKVSVPASTTGRTYAILMAVAGRLPPADTARSPCQLRRAQGDAAVQETARVGQVRARRKGERRTHDVAAEVRAEKGEQGTGPGRAECARLGPSVAGVAGDR